MSINKFSFFRAPISNTIPESDFTLLDAYHYIISDTARETTQQLRATSVNNRSILKQNSFDYCTFSATFSIRRKGGLLRHSNLVCFDFDHLDNVETSFDTLLKDKYFETLLLFRSPSGDGLKWVISLEKVFLCREKFFPYENQADYQLTFFNSVSYYLEKKYSLITDKSGKDVTRACFLPYDPSAYINEKVFL